jgi:hypothetical protein
MISFYHSLLMATKSSVFAVRFALNGIRMSFFKPNNYEKTKWRSWLYNNIAVIVL